MHVLVTKAYDLAIVAWPDGHVSKQQLGSAAEVIVTR
jgi:hypothetical protein